MPKRQSDPQDTRPSKRPRKASTHTVMSAPSASLPEQELQDKMLTTISPALLSGDGSSSKPGGGIRRRMNPESLAVRLGPDLVKELESLLVAGMTEMPSFAVRQEIQLRYGIDRRHIYDWFHNKGLRVASSEQREERRAARVRAAEGENSDKRSLRNTRALDAGVSGGRGQTCDPEPTESISTPLSSPILHAPLLLASSSPHAAACQQAAAVISPIDDYYTDEPSFASPCVFGLPPPALLGDTGDTDNPSLPGLLSPGYINVDSGCQVPAERTSLWIAEQQRITHNESVCLPWPVQNVENVLQNGLNTLEPPSSDGQPVLPKSLREAFYQSLADVLPPARGIEESVGSYKAFMTQQVQTFYEKITSSGRTPSSGSLVASSAGVVPQATALPQEYSVSSTRAAVRKIEYQSPLLPAATETSKPASGTPNEFSSWLLCGGRLHLASVPSPACTPALSEAATTTTSSGYWLPDPFHNHSRERSTASCMRLNELLESPVLRSRNPTGEPPCDFKPQSSTTNTIQPEGAHAHKTSNPGTKPTFSGPSFSGVATGAIDPSVPTAFVHEYNHGNIPLAPPAASAHRAVRTAAPTIFIAEPGSEKLPVTAHPRRTGGAAPKSTRGRGRPRGRPPGQQKATRNK